MKDFNDFRKNLHRTMTENEALNKRNETVVAADANRLKISKLLFDKMKTKDSKFREIYREKGGKPVNPMAYESVLETMQRRKRELECQRKKK